MAQDKSAADLLKDDAKRTEIFKTILNDHQLMMEFMDAMKDNDHAMMMIQNNPDIIGSPSVHGTEMSCDHHMMGMKNDNPEMMQNMKCNMMDMSGKDSTRCGNNREMMNEHHSMMMDQQNNTKGN